MKISLCWLLDHLQSTRNVPSAHLVMDMFNQKVAEIESYTEIHYDFQSWAIAIVDRVTSDMVTVTIPEWNITITLPFRSDAEPSALFFVITSNKQYHWATLVDGNLAKPGLIGAQYVPKDQLSGSWKNHIQKNDLIFDVNNTSITHRPDLWGHRGIAREIGALFDIPLVPQETLLASVPVVSQAISSISTSECSGLGTALLRNVHAIASTPWYSFRLLNVGGKPINALVDLTNYVMFDLGYPLHAFDQARIVGNNIYARQARNGEKLTTLDGTVLALHHTDIVIADDKGPLSLAGIMGGFDSGITAATTNVLLEAGCFNATAIRVSSLLHKKRTEASGRFEKSLDNHQIPVVLGRYLFLLDKLNISHTTASNIYVTLHTQASSPIVCMHHEIEKKLGIILESDVIIQLLTTLEFSVSRVMKNETLEYVITVPSFRNTITIKEDIIEEIGRLIGYNTIPYVLPQRPAAPVPSSIREKKYGIKSYLAHALSMHEIDTYALYNQQFLERTGYIPSESAHVLSPVSQNWQCLVSSLIPNMIAVILQNREEQIVRCFEWGKIWSRKKNDTLYEQECITGLFWDNNNEIDFYMGKGLLESLFSYLRINVSWQKNTDHDSFWYVPYQCARLEYASECIGYAGILAIPYSLNSLNGKGFIFELYPAPYMHLFQPPMRYHDMLKYPTIERDISIFVDLCHTVAIIQNIIMQSDARIIHVTLLDFYHDPSWESQKSLTFRLTLAEELSTLTRSEADTIMEHVQEQLHKIGAVIR